jgi:hypothetical protein
MANQSSCILDKSDRDAAFMWVSKLWARDAARICNAPEIMIRFAVHLFQSRGGCGFMSEKESVNDSTELWRTASATRATSRDKSPVC